LPITFLEHFVKPTLQFHLVNCQKQKLSIEKQRLGDDVKLNPALSPSLPQIHLMFKYVNTVSDKSREAFGLLFLRWTVSKNSELITVLFSCFIYL
jgi:hypothetical protein